MERARPSTSTPTTFLVSGGSGLVGTTLIPHLQSQGHSARRLVRRPATSSMEMSWNPEKGTIDPNAFSGIDAVIHLAGYPVAERRWTQSTRERILKSRVEGTRTLVNAVVGSPAPLRPKVFVSASAIGFYGSDHGGTLDESSPPGRGFLSTVCQEWEQALAPLENAGVRHVVLRTGVVLSPSGGALARMLPVFRAGLGGRLGDGRQWMSWITPEDLAGMFLQASRDSRWRGPFNAVSPHPVTQAEFAQTLAEILRRPAILPVPAFLLKAILGEMAGEMLLTSLRVAPSHALALGYEFQHPTLTAALRHLLQSSAPRPREIHG